MLTALAGIGLVGLAARLSSEASVHHGNRASAVKQTNDWVARSLASMRRSQCGEAFASASHAAQHFGKLEAEMSASGSIPPGFWAVNGNFKKMMEVLGEHCVRRKPIQFDRMMSRLPADFGGFDGAAKVCIKYFRGPSGKVRCQQWSSGPGYTPGPHDEDTYRIQDVRDFYARLLCADPKNRKKCGLSRKYRYRRSLPYLPREVAERNAPVPRVARSGVVKIIVLKPAPPLRRRRGER